MSNIRRSDVSGMLHAFQGGELFPRGNRGGAGVSPGIVTIRNMVPPTASSGLYSTAGCVFDPVGFTRDYASVEDAYNDYVANGIMLDVTLPTAAMAGDSAPIISLEPIGIGQLGRGMLRGAFGAFVWANTNPGSTGFARIRSVSDRDRIMGIPPIEICKSASAHFRVVAMFGTDFELNTINNQYRYRKCFAILVPIESQPVSVVRVTEDRFGVNGQYGDVKIRQLDDNFVEYYDPTSSSPYQDGMRKFPNIDIPAGMFFVADRSKLLYPLNNVHLASVTTGIGGSGVGAVRIGTATINNVQSDFSAIIPTGSSVYVSLRIAANSAVWRIVGIACTNITDLSNAIQTLGNTNYTATVAENSVVAINVLENATCAPNAVLTTISCTTPTNGTAVIVANIVNYTPRSGFSGTDSFNFTVSDGTASLTRSVTVTVNPLLPVARPDNVTTAFETPIVFSPIANDTVSAGKTASISSVGNGSNGTVTNLGGGNVRYTPNVGFAGIDTFIYRLYDGTNSPVVGTVTVLVTPSGV